MKFTSWVDSPQIVQILVITSACFSSIGDGMQYAWTSPSIPNLVADESRNLSIEQVSYLTVVHGFAMAISAPLGSVMIDKVGRRTVCLLVAVPQIIGWLIVAFSTNVWCLYLSRCIFGIGESLYFAAVPIYICEISDSVVRHGWANMISVTLYVGIFLVNVIGAQIDVSSTALVCLCFSALHLVTFWWVPESPYYLLMKNRTVDARTSLQILRRKEYVEDELATLTGDVQRQLSESGTWRNLFSIESNRKALVIVAGIRALQQFSGLSAFEMYAQYMFQEAKVDLSASASAIIFSGMLLVGPFSGAFVINKLGRKSLLLVSTLGCGCSLALEAIYFGMKEFTSVKFLHQLYWFPLCGMISYVGFCSLGLATLPGLIAGEMFSTSIKSKATIINNVLLAVWVLLIPKVFHMLTEYLGIFSPFCLFAISCFLGAFFVHFCVIETKGKTLEEIQQELKHNENNTNLTKHKIAHLSIPKCTEF